MTTTTTTTKVAHVGHGAGRRWVGIMQLGVNRVGDRPICAMFALALSAPVLFVTRTMPP